MRNRLSCNVRDRKTGFVALFRTTPSHTVCPNFYVLAHANGCTFSPQCTYCFLKSSFWYLGQQEAFGNIEDLLLDVRNWIAGDRLETYMLNAGNLSDSLCFESVRPLVSQLVETFRQYASGRPHTLLLVTKGGRNECQPLFDIAPCSNVIVSFSINHQVAARKYESGASSVSERLKAAAILKQRGWRIRIRIDPMIRTYDYSQLAQKVARFYPERVTLGTLRADTGLLKRIPNGMFKYLIPPTQPKGLARYPFEQRLNLYRQAVTCLRDMCPVGLCEEVPEMWAILDLDSQKFACNCNT